MSSAFQGRLFSLRSSESNCLRLELSDQISFLLPQAAERHQHQQEVLSGWSVVTLEMGVPTILSDYSLMCTTGSPRLQPNTNEQVLFFHQKE